VILLMYSNYQPSADHVRRLEDIAGRGRVAISRSESDALAHAGSTEIVLGHRYLRQLIPRAPRLRWVQTTAAGFDQLPWQDLRERGILLSRNPLNALSIAHHAISLAWALLRRLPLAMNNQARGVWGPPATMLPLPRTALVLGLGAVGTQVAKLLRGLGVRVRGADRSPTNAKAQACDEFLEGDRWRDALSDTDVLVLAVPLYESTRHCIGTRELALLPENAIVINIARAEVVDQRRCSTRCATVALLARRSTCLIPFQPGTIRSGPRRICSSRQRLPRIIPACSRTSKRSPKRRRNAFCPAHRSKRSSRVSRDKRHELRQRHRADPVHQ